MKLIIDKGDFTWLQKNGYMSSEQVGIFWDQLSQRCTVVNDGSSESITETKKELHVPPVKGSYLEEPKQNDMCIAFSLKSGKSLAKSLQTRMIQKGRTVSLIADDEYIDIHDIEKRVATAHALVVLLTEECLKHVEVVFSLVAAKFYYQHPSLVILVHDAESCYFPSYDEQPENVRDFFSEKAITYLTCYPEEGVLEILAKFNKEIRVLENIIENFKQKPTDALYQFLEKNESRGQFTTTELRQRMKPYLTKEQLDEFEAMADVNKDGTLDSTELQDILADMKKKLDANKKPAAATEEEAPVMPEDITTEDITTRVFLSHKRSTGQGIAGRFYEGLKHSYRVFIDSEAKFKIHNLKLIVQNTEVLVFILTYGILLSKWCLEELKAAISNKKRIVIVRELSFKYPEELPDEWKEVEPILKNSTELIWIAEYNTACVNALHKFIGAPDTRYRPAVKYFTTTKDGKTTLSNILNKFQHDKILDINKTIALSPNVEVDGTLDLVLQSIPASEITRLHISSISDTDVTILTTGIFARLPNLVEIDLSGTALVNDAVVEDLANRYPLLESLSLQQCVNVTSAATKFIAKNLKELRHLNMSKIMNLNDTAVSSLSEGCAKLEVLKLSYNDFTEKVFTYVAKFPSLKELELPWKLKKFEAEISKFKESHPVVNLSVEPLIMDLRDGYGAWYPAIAKSFTATQTQMHYYGLSDYKDDYLNSTSLKERSAPFGTHKTEYSTQDESHPFSDDCALCANLHGVLKDVVFGDNIPNKFFINEWYFTKEEGIRYLEPFIKEVATGKLSLTTSSQPTGIKSDVFIKALAEKSEFEKLEKLFLDSQNTAEAKKILPLFAHIKKLSFSFLYGVRPDELKELLQVIPPHLTDLSFENTALDNDTAALVRTKCPDLEVLYLKSQRELKEAGYNAIFGDNNKLKSVTIRDCNEAGISALEHLSSVKELTTLNITLNPLMKEDIIPVISKGFSNLKKLSVDLPVSKSAGFADFRKARPDVVVDENEYVRDIQESSGHWYPAIQVSETLSTGQKIFHLYGIGREEYITPENENDKDKCLAVLSKAGHYGAQETYHTTSECFYCSRLHPLCEHLEFGSLKNGFFINDWYFDTEKGKNLLAKVTPQGPENKLVLDNLNLPDGVKLWSLIRALKKQLDTTKSYTLRFAEDVANEDVNKVLDQEFPISGLEFPSNTILSNDIITAITAKVPKLSYLVFEFCTALTDEGFKKLDLPELTHLSLNSCKGLTDAGTEGIAKCTKLTYLHLAGTQLTDKSIESLSKNWTNLTFLNLRTLDITDNSIKILAENCPNIERLNIVFCKVTLDSFKFLQEGFSKLKEIKIPLALTNSEQLAAYKSSHPTTTVIERTEFIDAQDSVGVWYPSIVVAESRDSTSLFVHFYGWGDESNLWVTAGSTKVASLLTNKEKYGRLSDTHCATPCQWCQNLHSYCENLKFGNTKNMFFLNDWYMDTIDGKNLVSTVTAAVLNTGKLDLTVTLPPGLHVKTLAKAAVEQLPSDEIKKVTFPSDNTLELTQLVLGRVSNLFGADFSNVTDDFVPVLVEKASTLTNLSMQNSDITDDGFKPLTEVLEHLESFTIRNCRKLTDKSMEAIVQACQSLEDVNIDMRHQLTIQTARAIFQLPQLKLFKVTYQLNQKELEAEIEELRKKRPQVKVIPGIVYDALDTVNKWYPVLVRDVSADGSQVYIHYFGWQNQYDVWLPLDPAQGKVTKFGDHKHEYGNLSGSHLREGKCELCKEFVPEVTSVMFGGNALSYYL